MNQQPEQLLKELKDWQNKKKECQNQIDARKVILENYFDDGFILNKFEIDGIQAIRKRNPEKWDYSAQLTKYKKEIKDEIEEKEQYEREEGIAKKQDTSYSWSIR